MSLKTPENPDPVEEALRQGQEGTPQGLRARDTAGASSVGTLECLGVKPVREPDAGDPHVRFDERVGETGSWWEY